MTQALEIVKTTNTAEQWLNPTVISLDTKPIASSGSHWDQAHRPQDNQGKPSSSKSQTLNPVYEDLPYSNEQSEKLKVT